MVTLCPISLRYTKLENSASLDQTAPLHNSIWARGYKTFFMLNSAEHEILNACQYENIKKFSIFPNSENF